MDTLNEQLEVICKAHFERDLSIRYLHRIRDVGNVIGNWENHLRILTIYLERSTQEMGNVKQAASACNLVLTQLRENSGDDLYFLWLELFDTSSDLSAPIEHSKNEVLVDITKEAVLATWNGVLMDNALLLAHQCFPELNLD